MYLRYFGLKRKPFGIPPDPNFLVLSEKHSAAMAMIEYGIFEEAGITVVTGEVGTGKTTLIRHLLRGIETSTHVVGVISNVHSSLGGLFEWISLCFDIDYTNSSRVWQLRQLQEFLHGHYAQGRQPVVVMDEAQNMDTPALEELRMLTNLLVDSEQLLRIVLVGQPELLDRLLQPSMAQVAQRVTAEYHLQPLTLEETASYIHGRVEIAAGEPRLLFDREAIAAIYYFSGGVPRLINTLCDHALVLAYAAQKPMVGIAPALDAVRMKRIGGIYRGGHPPADADRARALLQPASVMEVAHVHDLLKEHSGASGKGR